MDPHIFGQILSFQNWMTDLGILDFESSSILFKSRANSTGAIAIWSEFNIVFDDKASVFFLCLGGRRSLEEGKSIWNLKERHFPVYRRIGKYGKLETQEFKYLGDFTPVSESSDRRTLGCFAALMERMRSPGGKPYALERVIIMAKENWEWEMAIQTYLSLQLIIDRSKMQFTLDILDFEKKIMKV